MKANQIKIGGLLPWKEKLQPCYVCGRVWTREEVKKWLFFNGLLVCRCHPGATKWYNGAIRLTEEKYKAEYEAIE